MKPLRKLSTHLQIEHVPMEEDMTTDKEVWDFVRQNLKKCWPAILKGFVIVGALIWFVDLVFG